MDPVTQAVLGGTIGEAAFRSRLGKKAGPFGAVVATLPDLDVVAVWAGDFAFLEHHRAASHSLLTLPLFALAVGGTGYLWDRKGGYWTWTHLSFWALITHPILDWCTAYGTELFWPIDRTRLACDAVAVIDPIYTLPLLVAFVLGCLRPPTSRSVRHVALAALCITTLYLAYGYAQSRRAYRLASDELHRQGFQVTELRATPTLFSIWLWRLTARDPAGNLRLGFVSTWTPRPIKFLPVTRPESPLIDKALRSREGKIFEAFAQRMLAIEVVENATGNTVFLADSRYNFTTAPRRTPFGAFFDFGRDGKLRAARRDRQARQVDVISELAQMWALIRGARYDPASFER